MLRLGALLQNSKIKTGLGKELISTRGVRRQPPKPVSTSRFDNGDGREEAVVFSNDERIIVCWHPEPKFPYECSKPLPLERKEESALKFKYDDGMKNTFRKIHPYFERERLEQMTFTTKHRWFPRSDRKLIKFKERMPRDREYL